MNRKDWTRGFLEGEHPSWPCPKCGQRTLRATEPLTRGISAATRSWCRNQFDFVPELVAGILECERQDCCETVAFCGSTSGWEEEADDGSGGRWVVKIHPHFLYPPIRLISIPKEAPESVRDEIDRASALYWHDPSAAGTRVRTALEIALSAIGIRRFVRRKSGGRRRLNLHERLDLLQAKRPLEADFGHAVKWLGNVGAHESALSRNDVLDAFELLEHLIQLLFATKPRRLRRQAALINRRKRPIPANKRKDEEDEDEHDE